MHPYLFYITWRALAAAAAATLATLCIAVLVAALIAMGVGHSRHEDRLIARAGTCARAAAALGIAAGIALVYVNFAWPGSFR